MRTVELLGFPVAAYFESRAHVESLARELALVAIAGTAPHTSATALRVRELVDAHAGTHTSALWQATHRQLEEALRRREDAVDLRFALPVAAAPGIERYRALLDEAEGYCRNGDLLTTEASPQVRSLRAWYFDQVLGQLRDGTPARPFPG